MRLRAILLLVVICGGLDFAPRVARAQEADAEVLFAEAWYTEEGLRDPAKAVALYREVAGKYPANKEIAAKALTRAAECYRKLGREEEEQAIGKKAWEDYREQIEKSPEYKDKSIRIRSYIGTVMEGAHGIDLVQVFGGILEKIPPQYIIPMRDDMLKQAAKQRDTDWPGAISSLRLSILLSMKIKDVATAARAQSDIGRTYLEQDLAFEAISVYLDAKNEYRDQRPVLAWNQMCVAEAYRSRSMTELAVSSYNDLLTTYPEQKEQVIWARLWIGDCYRDIEQARTAKQVWKELAEDAEAKDHPRQARLARIMAGLENPPAALDPNKKDEFSNDEAYFIAIRYAMDGDSPKAVQWMKTCIELSAGKDWPYQLARSWILNAGAK